MFQVLSALFHPRTVNVEFLADKPTLRRVCLSNLFRILPVSIIPPSTSKLVHHGCYINQEIDTGIKEGSDILFGANKKTGHEVCAEKCKLSLHISGPECKTMPSYDDSSQEHRKFGTVAVSVKHTVKEGDNMPFELKNILTSDVWLTVHRNSVWIRKTN